MTDKPAPLPTQTALPSQDHVPALAAPVVQNEVAVNAAQTVEEEPYTIKCICNFSDDDGNTIYCETCDTWQHIDCFYPNNREEAIREDFAHSCAECKPRPLDRQKAIERTLRLRNAVLKEEPADKKSKRPPSKSHKKKTKPADLQTCIPQAEAGKHGSPSEPQSVSKKAKPSHRPSHSISSQPSKRSPSYGTSRPNLAHPPSPASTPPDLPDDFQIHHYSAGFCSLYNEQDVPDTHNNAFASLAIPTALSRWLREPDTMRQEVGRTHAEVFQALPANADKLEPRLEVQDSTRSLNPVTTLRWRSVKSTAAIEKDVPIIELNGEIGFQKDYCVDPDNLWADLSSPLPFVFFHPILPLYIDTRKEGSLARYVRRSCKPNAQLDTYLSERSEYHFWLVSDRYISASEQITLPWDFRLEKSVHSRWLHLLGLSDDDLAAQDEPELDASEYTAISNWIDRILSEYGGCACDLDNNCAFARFHRHYLFGKSQGRSAKKRSRKSRNRTISPTSTSHATTSRAASEGHVHENADFDARNDSNSSRSKPPSRDRTPLQGQFDQLGILTEPTDRDKRKVAMVEDSFRRMEQQQPPRKKKRVSDGAVTSTSASTKPKSRNGSAAPPGRYADAGTSSRSKSGSPISSQSPSFANFAAPPSAKSPYVSQRRQGSAGPRPTYRDVSIQTDPVEGEWFSESCKSQASRKRIISLSKRLLNSRLKNRTGEEERKQRSLSGQTSAETVTDTESPTADQRPSVPSSLADPQSPKSPPHGDLVAPGSPQAATAAEAAVPTTVPTAAATTAIKMITAPEQVKIKTPDLRVQMPPVPAFDSGGVVTTPLSTSSTTVQSPIVGGLPSPFAPPAVNGISINPSPIKKKLSLSDYTKSRMNKAAGKLVGGTAFLKPGLASPEDIKVDVSLEQQALEKSDDAVSPSTPATATNGL